MPESAAARLEATLRRLAETEPRVGAYVTLDRTGAAEAAGRLDRGHDPGACEPTWLRGAPFAVKEVISVAGMAAAGGSRAFADHVAGTDATVVARLRVAGAVLVGTQVSHELTCGLDEPPTRNPWSPDRYPGGSSAGAGVSVAVGSAAFAIGTDAAGSVRIPAAVCGVVGLKPSAGAVSAHGVVRHATAPSIDNVGIVAASTAEVSAVLAAIAGPDPSDAATLWRPAPDTTGGGPPGASAAGLAGCRLGIPGEATVAALEAEVTVEPPVRAAYESACDLLSDLGAELVPVEIPGLVEAPGAVATFFSTELAAAHRHRIVSGRTEGYHPAVLEMLTAALRTTSGPPAEAVGVRASLTRRLGEIFATAGLDALITPTMPRTAMPLASFDPAGELGTLILYTCPFNLTGNPAVSVPCGFDPDGLPIGLQFVGRPLGDFGLLEVAAGYEQATDWHTHEPEVP